MEDQRSFAESSVKILTGQLQGLDEKADAADRAKRELQQEIQALRKEIRESVSSSDLVQDGLKAELRRWSEVHKVNRKSVLEFKKKVETKVGVGLLTKQINSLVQENRIVRGKLDEAVALSHRLLNGQFGCKDFKDIVNELAILVEKP